MFLNIIAPIIVLILLVFALTWWFLKYYYFLPKKEKKVIKNFFLCNMKQYQESDIVEIKKIHSGYTNISFYLKTKDHCTFQIRIAQNNEIVNRENEQKIILNFHKNNFFYLDNNGNFIKKWIPGRNVNKNDINDNFLIQLKKKIASLKKIDIMNLNLLKHDYEQVLTSTKIKKKYLDLYKQYLPIVNNKIWCFSHNDLNFDNVLIDQNNDIRFIDFEWARINHPDWDIVNFCRESNFNIDLLKKIANIFEINFSDFIQLFFISVVFAYDWSYKTSFSYKIFKFRWKTSYQLKRIYKYIKNKF